MAYCRSIYQTRRFPTRAVQVGNVGVGGGNPIRIQSMTTSNTRDVAATVTQAMRLADCGCEIIRVTVQGMKEAQGCEGIKNTLLQKGYTTALVADIHFYPPAALFVADFVDKVRINPGNFADKRASFKIIEYDDLSYTSELARIEEIFSPLVLKCKRLKKALRIGTNHGSLSDRIMNRYGDTPMGMVESAFEYLRVCRKLDYHAIIFSMKASNPLVMIQAYRLLVSEMQKNGWDYPLHLGVTEAGEGEDGRIKSAIGIGSLLLDGLGDTIRVSLTEDPWCEIDPCKRLIQFFEEYKGRSMEPFEELHRDFSAIERHAFPLASPSFLHADGSVVLSVSGEQLLLASFKEVLGIKRDPGSVDAIFLEEAIQTKEQWEVLKRVEQAGIAILSRDGRVAHATAVYTKDGVLPENCSSSGLLLQGDDPEEWQKLLTCTPAFILFAPTRSALHEARHFFEWLRSNGIQIPVLLHLSYACSFDDLVIRASMEAGSLLADGLGVGLSLFARGVELDRMKLLSFGILQGARMRMSKTDFISCPGCGRTLFQLQQVTSRIRLRTGHLPGVKIAIMGCIVNGPGEMADADFGYVGSKPGKIDLYVGKRCVERDIAFDEAEGKLVELIKSHGRWQEPCTLPSLS